jgi:hypothetical protein
MPDHLNAPEFDALAAEYVLGTLDASERAHTRVLLDIDGEFAAKVRMWERRLGELHLMVEPIEPDWQVFERVKARIGGFEANPFYQALGARKDNESAQAAPEDAPQQPPPPGLWDTTPGEAAAPEPVMPEAGLPPAAQAAAEPVVPEAGLPPAAQAAAEPVVPEAGLPPAAQAAAEPVVPEAGLLAAASAVSEPVVPEAELPPAAPAEPLAAPDAGEGVSASSSMLAEATAEPTPSPDLAETTAGPPLAPPVPEAPPLPSPAPMPRELAAVEPRTVQPISRPESERTIPVSTISRGRTVAAPEAPSDVVRWRRSIRQWRTFALLMTVLALTLASFMAALRNFPERLPASVRAQFITTAAAPLGDVLRPGRPPAPPESQFEE